MEEPTLRSQTGCIGEAMRCYRSSSLPGIDMLVDSMELTTAKQAQSVSRQRGCAGLLSELYGVTNWKFDFKGHKGQGDWQAALGVTLRCPHLSLVSLAGEGKRDYPASTNYQSPWYKVYSLVEDHFARANTVMTRGKAVVRVGVIHPIESYWLCYGPIDQTSLECQERDDNFIQLTNWLLNGLIDFDFISESHLYAFISFDKFRPTLNSLDTIRANQFPVGECQYDCIIVPNLRTIRSMTWSRLEAFAENGGRVVFTGEVPSLIDAKSTDRVSKWVANRPHCYESVAKLPILQAMESYREVKATSSAGLMSQNLLHQIREDNGERMIFLCDTDRDFHGGGYRFEISFTVICPFVGSGLSLYSTPCLVKN